MEHIKLIFFFFFFQNISNRDPALSNPIIDEVYCKLDIEKLDHLLNQRYEFYRDFPF